jgi:hypothetical protein
MPINSVPLGQIFHEIQTAVDDGHVVLVDAKGGTRQVAYRLSEEQARALAQTLIQAADKLAER